MLYPRVWRSQAARRGRVERCQLQAGGSAPNTAGLQSQVASAVDQLGSEFRQDGARILQGFGDLVSFGSALGGAAAGAGQAMVVPDAGDAILATSGVGAALADGPLPFGDAYLASVAAYIGSSRLIRGALALGEGVARLGARGITRGIRSRATFSGHEVRAMRDLSHVTESTLRAQAKLGFASKDAQGRALILHHHRQNPAGPIIEMPAVNHSIGNVNQHPFGNTAGLGLTEMERAGFNTWRVEYWKARAQGELARRGL